MPRKPPQESPTGIYHWITRGINRRHLFHFKDDYLYFLDLARIHSRERQMSIFHYCLMPNHIHMLLGASSVKDLGHFAHFVKRRYAYYHSKTAGHNGASFERMYKGISVGDEAYLLECARYIERNSLRANLASRPEDYLYSSYRFYALGEPNDLITPSPAYLALGGSDCERQKFYVDYITAHRPQEEFASSSKFNG
jgi:putative transposase